ncbi:heat shock 70 kDa protein 12A-like isoform X2 [Dreissena polymorpha]|uniref:heat shock 70 kDa protein 12A-like isoform X2 n=1 Tax=Dreissena polymorpha TaxID=45954 RepID=UPI00226563BB|nr:heat shock 70 kDa protein 12A-like isoform X2 [Dreissena polymorpha]
MGSQSTKTEQPTPTPLVIAIDVGSYASGCALLYYTDYEKNRLNPHIYVNKEWGGDHGMESSKTQTALLIKEKNNPTNDLFGQKAIKTYSDYHHAQHKRWRFFQRFKMQLLNQQRSIDFATQLEDSDGRHLPAIIVFSRFIKSIKDYVLKRVTSSGSVVDVKRIKWVITVPAIWPDRAKSLMRLAAQKSDIPGANVVIAIEPECAAIHAIRSVSAGTHHSKTTPSFASPGSVFMIVDMGGGTVDILLLEVINELHRMKQVQAPVGGPWGGNYVDDLFFEILKKVVGEDVFSKFQAENPTEFLDLQREFEYEKRTVKHSTEPEPEPFSLKIPGGLLHLWTDSKKQRITEIVRNITVLGGNLDWNASRLVFPPEIMWGIFKKATDETIKCIKKYIKQAGSIKIKAILVVGGFSCSGYVIPALEEKLSYLHIPIYASEWDGDGDLAVLKGAALFGHDEHSIVSRKLAYTYGLSCIKTFDISTHSQQHTFEHEGKTLANAVFQKIVTRGQIVKSNQWIDANVYYPNDGADKITIYVHASSEDNPIHVTEESCWCVGMFEVDCSSSSQNIREREVRVSMQFGGTEIAVKAQHIASGKCTESKLLLP